MRFPLLDSPLLPFGGLIHVGGLMLLPVPDAARSGDFVSMALAAVTVLALTWSTIRQLREGDISPRGGLIVAGVALALSATINIMIYGTWLP